MRSDENSLNSPRCLVIAVYFGPLPSYFEIFKRSIGFNPGVDFLLVTDQAVPGRPPNLFVSRMTFREFKSKTAEALGVSISMPRPYKICDFRPAFGHIFAEELSNYSHWGHCDLDVIFGNILGNIPSEAFQYPKILVRGNFALYENSKEANSWYRTILPDVDYRRVFSTPNPFHFDESAGILRILEHLGVRVWNEECIFNIEWENFRMRAVGSPPGFHVYVWQDGRVLEYSVHRHSTEPKVREAILIHLMKRPMKAPGFDVESVGKIVVGSDQFFAIEANAEIRKLPTSHLMLARNAIRHRVRRLRRRLSKRGDLRPLA